MPPRHWRNSISWLKKAISFGRNSKKLSKRFRRDLLSCSAEGYQRLRPCLRTVHRSGNRSRLHRRHARSLSRQSGTRSQGHPRRDDLHRAARPTHGRADLSAPPLGQRPRLREMFDPMPEVIATFEDGSKTLFKFYPDEISFRESEFVGLTEEEAHSLFQQKDTAYLRS